MRVRHPIDLEDVGVVDAAVDVNGELVPIEDGTFEIDESDRSWLERWADGYGYEPNALIVDESDAAGDETNSEASTCEAVKSDGEVCGRELPCPYHTED